MIQSAMKTRVVIASLILPALLARGELDKLPVEPTLPHELLESDGRRQVDATSQPQLASVVRSRAPRNAEQPWMKLLRASPKEDWRGVVEEMTDTYNGRRTEKCHGFVLCIDDELGLRFNYDGDITGSGIILDGQYHDVLYVEFSRAGIRSCPLQGYELSENGPHGGVCWQTGEMKAWNWQQADLFWESLPKLLQGRRNALASQKRGTLRSELANGRRMVVFWGEDDFPLEAYWPSFIRLHGIVGEPYFSLVFREGLKLYEDQPGVPKPVPAPPTAAGTLAPTGTPAAGGVTTPATRPTKAATTPPAAGSAAPAATAPATRPAKGKPAPPTAPPAAAPAAPSERG